MLTAWPGSVLCQTTSIDQLMNYGDSTVLVAAHRGDWRNHPENSLSGIQSCIDMHIDIVEVDVRETKDGKFILMHDASINRTTNGRGRVKDMTLEKLQTYFLKDHDGKISEERIPSLEEALELAKGKIVLNLDKSAICMDELLVVLDSTDSRQTVILKGSLGTRFYEEHIRDNPDGPLYMPILYHKPYEEIDTFLARTSAQLVELILNIDTTYLSKPDSVKIFANRNCRIWYNALYKGIASGYGENRNALMTWDHFLSRDAFIIQTDYPKELMQYLIDRGRHKEPEGWEPVNLSGLPDKVIDTAAMHRPNPNNSGSRLYHTIKKGDTFYSLAKKYHTSVSAIRKLNPGVKPERLQIGQRIRIR
jgi:glycerophosphoryl diester phosphodiesterase